MEVSPFLSLCEGLVVERSEHTATTIAIAITSTSLVVYCPRCQEPSQHFHGYFQQTVADLPCSGRQVTLHLKVRKFVCLNLACPRVIFAERFPELVRFGVGLTQDEEPVRASLLSLYSQSVVEGHVNRLKLIKRTMYGRASFPLLRQRVLQKAERESPGDASRG